MRAGDGEFADDKFRAMKLFLNEKFVDELLKNVRVIERLCFTVHNRDQPLLIETGRQKNAAIDAVNPLRICEIKISGFVVAIILNRFA